MPLARALPPVAIVAAILFVLRSTTLMVLSPSLIDSAGAARPRRRWGRRCCCLVQLPTKPLMRATNLSALVSNTMVAFCPCRRYSRARYPDPPRCAELIDRIAGNSNRADLLQPLRAGLISPPSTMLRSRVPPTWRVCRLEVPAANISTSWFGLVDAFQETIGGYRSGLDAGATQFRSRVASSYEDRLDLHDRPAGDRRRPQSTPGRRARRRRRGGHRSDAATGTPCNCPVLTSSRDTRSLSIELVQAELSTWEKDRATRRAPSRRHLPLLDGASFGSSMPITIAAEPGKPQLGLVVDADRALRRQFGVGVRQRRFLPLGLGVDLHDVAGGEVEQIGVVGGAVGVDAVGADARLVRGSLGAPEVFPPRRWRDRAGRLLVLLESFDPRPCRRPASRSPPDARTARLRIPLLGDRRHLEPLVFWSNRAIAAWYIMWSQASSSRSISRSSEPSD